MRVVTYARVSTAEQGNTGQSLANQERAFATWVDRGGHVRVRAYAEAASAGTVEGRAIFQQMIADLPHTRPDAIVIDTLDRFTRDARAGLNLLHEIRGHGVGLLPLDWRREEPIRLDDDRDWQDLYDEFGAAERERRRIRRRVLRSFEGRRERGATTINKAPFGLRKSGDRLVAVPERADLILEMDRRAVEGESLLAIARWMNAQDPKAPHTRKSVVDLLRHRGFLEARLRTPATQERLDAILALNAKRFGFQVRGEHEFTGVFACGVCVAAGHDPNECLMAGGGNTTTGSIKVTCNRAWNRTDVPRPHARRFTMTEDRIRPLWIPLIEGLSGSGVDIESWATSTSPDVDARRRSLSRQVARLDQREAALHTKRDKAVMLIGEGTDLDRQAREILRSVDAEAFEIAFARESLAAETERIPATKRDPEKLREILTVMGQQYARLSVRDRNQANRMLCEMIGHPILSRTGPTKWDDPVIEWPGARALLGKRRRKKAPV